MFTERSLWTAQNFGEVRRAFVDRPDESGDTFSAKLLGQMADATPEAQLLMAEMLWAILLFPSKIRPAKKREIIASIWNLSGQPFPERHSLLADHVLSGIGSAGMGFNNHRWRELVLLVDLVEMLKGTPMDKRKMIFADYDEFLSFIESVPQDGHRQFRHMLRYFTFPARVERMSSSGDRRKLLHRIRGIPERDLAHWDHRQLDAAVLELRRELEAAHPGEIIDFYEEPLRSRWSDQAEASEESMAIEQSIAVELWAAFMGRFPDFVDFANPGERFAREELNYKRRGLQKFTEAGGRTEMRRLLDENNPAAALQIVLRTCALNIANHHSWRKSIGLDNSQALAPVLRSLLEATDAPYSGRETLAPVFATIRSQKLVPAWDTLSVMLWALRPTDYFPIKISYYRDLAEKIGLDLDAGRPDADRFHAVMLFGKGIWAVASPKNPRDWVDVQSFLWAVCNAYQAEGEAEDGREVREVADSLTSPPSDREAAGVAYEPGPPFDRGAALAQLFMAPQQFDQLVEQLHRKKNLVLQGPPGVGKTFVARMLGYAVMSEIDPSRVQMVQFHQSYGYEEFVQGLRPTKTGDFVVREGVFVAFCRRAARDPRPHVFIIDEINRGNLSKILGELMMLLEPDKRGAHYAMPLAYDDPSSPRFFVPPNVHVIGLMNTADRSLAMVDYALRRRFAFVTLQPEIASEKFRAHLRSRNVPDKIADAIVGGITRLNAKIAMDASDLGPGYCIGHSYFCPPEDMASASQWLMSVLEYEIKPLLSEYWMEKTSRADEEIAEIRRLFA